MGIRDLRAWIKANIACERRPSLECQWDFGRRLIAHAEVKPQSWRALAKSLDRNDSTVRQAIKFHKRCTKSEARQLDKLGVSWRAVIGALGTEDGEAFRELLAEMKAGQVTDARAVDEHLGIETKPTRRKRPTGLSPYLQSIESDLEKAYAVINEIYWRILKEDREAWREKPVIREAIALAELCDTLSVDIREIYLRLLGRIPRADRSKWIERWGAWLEDDLARDAEWLRDKLALVEHGDPSDDRFKRMYGITGREFMARRELAAEAWEYFAAISQEDTAVRNMISTDEKIGKFPRAAAWYIAERDSCCRAQSGGLTIATPYCREWCYGGPAFKGPLYRGRHSMKPKAIRNAELRNRDDFVQLMTGAIVSHGVRTFRIHIVGDFDSPEYLRKWIKVVEALPWVDFLLFTRAWRIKSMVPGITKLAENQNAHVLLSYDKSAFDVPDIPNTRTALLLDEQDKGPTLPGRDVVAFRSRDKAGYKKNPLKKYKTVTVCPHQWGVPDKRRRNTTKLNDDGNVVSGHVPCDRCRICLGGGDASAIPLPITV